MNCRDEEKEMILSVNNDLNPKKKPRLENHLKDCLSCSKKYAEIKKDLEWMADLPGNRPEFDWEKSWDVIQKHLTKNTWARERRIVQIRRVVRVAAVMGIFLLGIVIGRHILLPPGTDRYLRSNEQDIARRLIQKHLEETGMALLEFKNRESFVIDQRILELEKKKAQFLLFQNRTLQSFLGESVDNSVNALLKDLEILLYEASNFEPASPEVHVFIKTLIQDKDILFRIRQIGSYQARKANQEATL